MEPPAPAASNPPAGWWQRRKHAGMPARTAEFAGRRVSGWVGAHSDALTIAALAVLLVVETLYLKGWTYPIISDRSFHLYSAQEIARGRTPYVDFHNNHPPLALMLLALPMWLFPALAAGKGPAYVHLAWTVLWTAGGAVATYYAGKRLIGSWLGGAVAAWLLIALTPLLMIHSAVGQNRILVMSAMVLAVAFMQRDRWFWAGIAIGVGFMAYYPAIIAAAGAWVLVTGSRGRERWRRLGRLGLGFAVPLTATVGWLAARSALGPWFSETLLWPVSYGLQTASQVSGEGAAGLLARLSRIGKTLSRAYLHGEDWLLVTAGLTCLAFCVSALARPGRRAAIWSNRATAPVLLLSLLSTGYLLVEGGGLDRMLALPFVAVWAAFGICFAFDALKSRRVGLARAALVVLVLVLLAGSGSTLSEVRRKIAAGERLAGGEGAISLDAQLRASSAWEPFLPAGRRVQVMGELWPLVVGGRENSSSFYHSGDKMRLAADLTGSAADGIFRQVLGLQPEAVLFSLGRPDAEYGQLAALLTQDGYVCTGIAGRLIIFVQPRDAGALAGAIAMQQALSEAPLADSEGIAPEQVALMAGVDALEVAPGMLLIAGQAGRHDGATELHLFWWTWLQPEEQAEIWLEIVSPQGEVARRPVTPPALPPLMVTRRDLLLPGVDGRAAGESLRLISIGGTGPDQHPCKAPISLEPVTLHVATWPAADS